MIILLLIFILLILQFIFFSGTKYEKKMLLVPTIFLFLFGGLRKGIGGYDYYVYEYFYNLPKDQNPYNYEIAFVKLRNLFQMLGFNYNYFLMFLSFLFIFTLYYLFITYSTQPTFSLLIYFSLFYFWQNFTILRNFIAIIIFWLGIKYIVENNFIKYIVLCIVAFLFHKSAIIAFPMYFILKLKPRKKIITLVFIVSLILNIFSNLVFSINIEMFGLSERLLRYVNINEHGNKLEYLEMLVLNIVLYIALFKRREAEDEKLVLEKEEIIFYNMSFISLVIFTIFLRYAIVLRFLEYFRLGIALIIPYIIFKIKNENYRYLAAFILILYLFYRFYNGIFDYGLINYKTWIF
ncbi:MAG: EpsG family protein [Fusobacteriaceae bacterium]